MRVAVISCLVLATLVALANGQCANVPTNDFSTAPTIVSAAIVGANYVFEIDFPHQYDKGITVQFNGAAAGSCQLGLVTPFYVLTTDATVTNAPYTITYNGATCLNRVTFSVATATMLGTCGFTQDSQREANTIHFINTVTITARREAQVSGGSRTISTTQVRTYDFTIDIEAPTTVSGTSSNANVFGEVIPIFLVESLTVDSVIDGSNAYPGTFTGRLVFQSSVQSPYSLKLNGDGLTVAGAVSSVYTNMVVTAAARCTADGTPCAQTWQLDFSIPLACRPTGVTALSIDDLQFDFLTECNTVFAANDACAPSFTKVVTYVVDLSSPGICPREASFTLAATVDLYRINSQSGITPAELAADFAKFTPDSTSAERTATGAVSSSFTSESVFSYESFLFGEISVTVNGNAATLTGTSIFRLTAGRDPAAGVTSIVLYNGCPSGVCDSIAFAGISAAGTGTSGNALVNGLWFDTTSNTVASVRSNSRARFGVLNTDVTLPRSSAEKTQDAAVAVKYTVEAIVKYQEGAPASMNPILNVMSLEAREKETMVVQTLFANNNAGASATTSAVVIAPATTTPASSSSSSAISGSALMIGGIAVGAAVLGIALTIVIMRRRNNNKAPADATPATLLGSSSSTQLVSIRNCYSAAQDEALTKAQPQSTDLEAQTSTSA